MLIVGAKGFAKEVLEIQHQLNELEDLVFYDDVNMDVPAFLFDQFKVLKSPKAAKDYFNRVDYRFTIGIGDPLLRYKMYHQFNELGGVFTSTISPLAQIGHYNVSIAEGCNILHQAILSNDISIGKGCIIYFNSLITHDVKIGDFVEVSPNVALLGRCTIGDFTQIGSHATVLPDISIGMNVVVAAGAVVTKSIPDNCLVAGVPAQIKKERQPLTF